MKYKVLSIILSLVFAFSALGLTAYADTAFEIKELNMQIKTPDDVVAISRLSTPQDPVFQNSGLDYNNTMKILEDDNVYLYAQAKDGSYKITLSMIENDESRGYYDFTTLSDSQKEEITQTFKNQPECTNCYTYELKNGQAFFFCPTSKYTSSSGSPLSIAQYITIVNGQRIVVQLAVNSTTYTNEQVEVLKNIVDSINFSTITKKFFDFNSVLPYIIVLVAAVVVFVIAIILIMKRKKRNIAHATASEENAKLEEFLENTQRYDSSENKDEEPEEPLIIITDAAKFDAEFGKAKKPINETEVQVPSGDSSDDAGSVNTENVEMDSPDKEQEVDDTSTNETETQSENSDNEDFVTYESMDLDSLVSDNLDDEDFVVAEGSANEDHEDTGDDSHDASDVNLDLSDHPQSLIDDKVDVAPEDKLYVNKSREDHKYKSYSKAKDKESSNIPLKILKGIGNAFIGAGLLIIYLVSLAISSGKNSKKQNKKSKKTHNKVNNKNSAKGTRRMPSGQTKSSMAIPPKNSVSSNIPQRNSLNSNNSEARKSLVTHDSHNKW